MSTYRTTSIKKTFISEDFLLTTDYARELYHDYAKDCPIIDYHNHLPPQEIAENRLFESITQVWLKGDHYKWRAMRAQGIDESLITGDATDREKFMAYAKSVPYFMRNPLYHWTHLELLRYFDIDELLNGENAERIYERCNELLSNDSHRVQGMLDQMNVETVCTTDDPIDDLAYHKQIARNGSQLTVLPAFRPDKAVSITSPNFMDYLDSLGEVTNIEIKRFGDVVDALMNRIEYFHEAGCRVSDHGLNQLPTGRFSRKASDKALAAAMRREEVPADVADDYMFTLMQLLCREYARRGWVQQFHLGALRNNNSRMLSALGPDTGWDSIGDYAQAERMSLFLNSLDSENLLAKTILYNLNPADNAVFAAMIGNFNDGSIAGKIQYGSGWWFLDQLDGMRDQINTLSNMGLISRFIGMLTDSRSFLSFPRHEYFRRLLCAMFGEDIKNGLLPADIPFIGGMIKDISYHNAKNYFDF